MEIALPRPFRLPDRGALRESLIRSMPSLDWKLNRNLTCAETLSSDIRIRTTIFVPRPITGVVRNLSRSPRSADNGPLCRIARHEISSDDILLLSRAIEREKERENRTARRSFAPSTTAESAYGKGRLQAIENVPSYRRGRPPCCIPVSLSLRDHRPWCRMTRFNGRIDCKNSRVPRRSYRVQYLSRSIHPAADPVIDPTANTSSDNLAVQTRRRFPLKFVIYFNVIYFLDSMLF